MGNEKFSIFRANENHANRVTTEKDHPIRNCFQRDRDRILYSKEFRRLSSKTQVFVTGFDDNMRTRLTHTLEVSQIACTIADYFCLNNALVEAIALGHDVGHTPFGHVGERTLNYFMNDCFNYYSYGNEEKGFKHNIQSIRVLTDLEKMNQKYSGLNLTQFTLWGILNHSDIKYNKPCEFYNNENELCTYRNSNNKCSKKGILSTSFYDKYLKKFNNCIDWTFEGIIVAIADEIAQRHHDIEDGLYANIIDINDVVENLLSIFSTSLDADEVKELKKIVKITEKEIYISQLSKIVVNFYVNQYIKNLEANLNKIIESYHIDTNKSFEQNKEKIYKTYNPKEGTIIDFFGYNTDFSEKDNRFHKYLCQIILTSELAQSMDGKATFIIKRLIKAYLSNFQQLPDNTILLISEDLKKAHLIDSNKNDTNKSKSIKVSLAREHIKSLQKNNNPKFQNILLRRICDFIAGMTDKFAMQQYEKLYGAKY